MSHTSFHNSMTSGQSVNWDCHGTKRPASTKWRAHTCTFSYPKPFSQALVCWCVFLPFFCVQSSVCVSRDEAPSKDSERIFTFNLGEIKCTFFFTIQPAIPRRWLFLLFCLLLSNHSVCAGGKCRLSLVLRHGFPDGQVNSETAEKTNQTHASNTTVSWRGSIPRPLIPSRTMHDLVKWNQHSNSPVCYCCWYVSEPYRAVLPQSRFLWYCDAQHFSLLVHIS